MTKDRATVSSSGIGVAGLGLAFFIGMFQYGPVDLPRAVYNSLTGDTPVIKRQIGNYITCKEREANPSIKENELAKKLSYELRIPLKDGKVDFQNASLDNLFDASEERSGFFDSFVWLRLDNYKSPKCADF